MANVETKRECSPWASGISDETRKLVEETSNEYVNFEEYWAAAVSQLEAEAELTETMELVAEYRGWSGQLVRRRRTADGKSAEKRGRLATAGDDMKIYSFPEESTVSGVACNPDWKHLKSAGADAVMEDASAAAASACAAQSASGGARKSAGAAAFAEKMRVKAAEAPEGAAAKDAAAVSECAAKEAAAVSECAAKPMTNEEAEIDMHVKIRNKLKDLNNVKSKVEQQGLDLTDEKISAVVATIAVATNQSIEKVTRIDDEAVRRQRQADTNTQAIAKIVDVTARTESFRTTINIVKKKTTTVEEFKRYVWVVVERRCKDKDLYDLVAEGKCLGAAGRIVVKWESDAKSVSAKLFAALREEGFEKMAAVFIGKADMKRAMEDQQNAVFHGIEEALHIKSPEEKRVASLRTRWPSEKNAHSFCYYFVTEDGARTKEVLAAGKMRMEDLSVDIWIWDDHIRKEFESQITKMGEKMLYRTVDRSATLKVEQDMMQFAPSEQEIKDQAAKGKKKGAGRSNDDNIAGGGAKSSGGKSKGGGGGRIPAWNGGKGAAASSSRHMSERW